MNALINLQDRILNVNPENFDELALEAFEFQSKNCAIYSEYLKLLNKHHFKPSRIHEIPFLPTELFKHRIIQTGNWKEEIIFKSSGTTQNLKSRHFVKSISWYHQIVKKCFEYHYGSVDQYLVLGLLPSCSERPNSSLVSMFEFLSGNKESNKSFLHAPDQLFEYINSFNATNKKIILLGLSYALLDFAEQYKVDSDKLIVIETGGMKSSTRNIDKKQLLEVLRNGFHNASIHSEYGMTELMSQAYASDAVHYNAAPLLKFLISDYTDYTEILKLNSRGIINIIDLGNIHSCCFLQTGDMGILNEQNNLQVLGRFNQEEQRGCVQMYE